jgi:hypothetical protein
LATRMSASPSFARIGGPLSGTARASMRSAGGQMAQGTTAEVRLDQGKALRGNPTILLHTGSIAIEFCCGGTTVGHKIIKILRKSAEFRFKRSP